MSSSTSTNPPKSAILASLGLLFELFVSTIFLLGFESNMAIGSTFRRVINWMIPVILLITYVPAMFRNPKSFVGDLSPSEEGRDAAEIWAATPPTARGLAPQLAGWALCWVTCMLTFLIFAPEEKTHVLLARSNAIIMLGLWPIVWYGAMLPKEDYQPMDFNTYWYTMSIGETILGVIYIYTGWFVPIYSPDAIHSLELSKCVGHWIVP